MSLDGYTVVEIARKQKVHRTTIPSGLITGMVFEEAASFRQTPTLQATWTRRDSQPQIPPPGGEPNTQKIFGAIRLDNPQFIYLQQEDYFEWEAYFAFPDRVLARDKRTRRFPRPLLLWHHVGLMTWLFRWF